MRVRPLLHRLSIAEAEAELIPVTAESVRAASFIDGRSEFGCGAPRHVPLPHFLANEAVAAPPLRMIFHVGFCGSTWLARMLDIPGKSLVLREPNCLADLANQQAAAVVSGLPLEQFSQALAAVGRHLSRPWNEGEVMVVKGSNWINILLPYLAGMPILPLFLTSSRRRFVTAVLRGGPARVAFTARAAIHLSSGDRKAAEFIARALGADDNGPRQLARLAVIAHEIQMRQFRAAADKNGWGCEYWLDHTDLVADPVRAVSKAAGALDLDLPLENIKANALAWSERHAKQPLQPFSYEGESATSAAVESHLGAEVDGALSWSEEFLKA